MSNDLEVANGGDDLLVAPKKSVVSLFSSIRSAEIRQDVIEAAKEKTDYIPSLRIIQPTSAALLEKHGVVTNKFRDKAGDPIPTTGLFELKGELYKELICIPLTERPVALHFSPSLTEVLRYSYDISGRIYKEIAEVRKNRQYVHGIEVLLWVPDVGPARFLLKSTSLDELPKFLAHRGYLVQLNTKPNKDKANNKWWTPIVKPALTDNGQLIRAESLPESKLPLEHEFEKYLEDFSEVKEQDYVQKSGGDVGAFNQPPPAVPS